MVANNELDDLVREVIKENPPEEQGIRPEWQNHVGWHRKENIFKLRGRKEGDVSKQLGVHQNSLANIDESNQSLSGLHKVHTLVSFVSIVTVLIIISARKCYCKTNSLCYIKLRKKNKADVV
jgi:hypothetical protein